MALQFVFIRRMGRMDRCGKTAIITDNITGTEIFIGHTTTVGIQAVITYLGIGHELR
jgi:hypothetical protein